MAHHVYTTKSYLIESTPSGEANKSYLLFTRDLGMIRPTAQGVRLLKSKLRFSLQDFSVLNVSVVRGKDIWRITSAQGISNLYEDYKHQPAIIKAIAQIFFLIKRLIPGEEKNEQLFSVLEQAFEFLKNNQLSDEQVISFECVVVLNILYELGYLATLEELETFIDPIWAIGTLDHMESLKKTAYREINKSLRETQL